MCPKYFQEVKPQKNLIRQISDQHDDQGEEYTASRFGQWKDYYARKRVKLQNQDAVLRQGTTDDVSPQIFKDCVIFVNGYTIPSRDDIRQLVVKNGGVFMQYMQGKLAVTHIIASMLTPKKISEFARYRLVSPAWITESVAAGKLLAWTDFSAIPDSIAQTQLKFAPDDKTHSSLQVVRGRRGFTGSYKNEMNRMIASRELMKVKRELDSGIPDTTRTLDQSTNTISTVCTRGAAETAEQHNERLLSNPRIRRASAINPNFLKSYFESSRLHHLSTWKANLKDYIQNMSFSQETIKTSRIDCLDRIILHVDFDCFFASVAMRDDPSLESKPLCVTHGCAKKGTNAEISSCNYVAREKGVRNGMWMDDAIQLCPNLVSVPYNFPMYEKASLDLYNTLLGLNCDALEVVSVDEALLDCTSLCNSGTASSNETYKIAEQVAQELRNTIKLKTGLDISVGIGPNVFLAHVALRKGKPAGQYCIRNESALEVISSLDVKELPGVGYKLARKLREEMHVNTIGELKTFTLTSLQNIFGTKTGIKLHKYCRGLDTQRVGNFVERKSISVEVNWGIRFTHLQQVTEFMLNLSAELQKRMLERQLLGKNLQMKVMVRADSADFNPVKFLGHGECVIHHKTILFGIATNHYSQILKGVISMLNSYNISPGDYRGIALKMGQLEQMPSSKQKQERLSFISSCLSKQSSDGKVAQPLSQKDDIHVSMVEHMETFSESNALPRKSSSRENVMGANLFGQQKIDIYCGRFKPHTFSYKNRPKYTRTNPTTLSREVTLTQLGWVHRGLKTAAIPMIEETIDEATLAELPPTIRQEVLEELNMCTSRAKVKPALRTKKDVNKQTGSREAQRDIVVQDKITTPAAFKNKIKVQEVRGLITEWFEYSRSNDGLHEDDVTDFITYLDKLMSQECNFLKAQKIVQWIIYLSTLETDFTDWNKFLTTVVDRVQDACRFRGTGPIVFNMCRRLHSSGI